jgi:hypothetical protein
MGLGLIVLALLFGAAAINGTVSSQNGQTGLGDQLNSDLFGTTGSTTSPGVLKWFGAMIVLAAIFKMLHMPGTGKAFSALIILAYFAKNPGIVTQISTQISGLQSPAGAAPSGSLGAGYGTGALGANGPASAPAGSLGAGLLGNTGGGSSFGGAIPGASFSSTPTGNFQGILGGFGL